jgi:hypothetical protein
MFLTSTFFLLRLFIRAKKRSYIYVFYIQRRHWRNSASVDSGIHKIALDAGQDTHNMHVTFSGIYERIDDGLDLLFASSDFWKHNGFVKKIDTVCPISTSANLNVRIFFHKFLFAREMLASSIYYVINIPKQEFTKDGSACA